MSGQGWAGDDAAADIPEDLLAGLFSGKQRAGDPLADIGFVILKLFGQRVVFQISDGHQMLKKATEAVFLFHKAPPVEYTADFT